MVKFNHYKAHWVAKGFTQQWGDNYQNLHTCGHVQEPPVQALTCLRNLKIHTMDIISAFLHAELVKEIYIKQPEGYVDTNKPNHIC